MRLRETAKSKYKWNAAIRAFCDEFESKVRKERGITLEPEGKLVKISRDLFVKAGFPEGPPFASMPKEAIESYSQWTLEG